MSPLDHALREPVAPPSAETTARVRAALSAELARGPQRPWRRDAWLILALALALPTVGAAVFGLTGGLSFGPERLPALGLLVACAAACGWAAASPRARGSAWGACAAGLGAVAVVVSHGETVPSSSPEWLCTVSHVAAALPGLVLAALVLRRTAPSWRRALVAGLGVGTTGAMFGELACAQGVRHALVFHLSAWAVVAGLAVLASRLTKARSYAP